jgi:hypothetical protein
MQNSLCIPRPPCTLKSVLLAARLKTPRARDRARGFDDLITPSTLHHTQHRRAVAMTHSQACRPCAKRKVRCDKLQPCSNCRRRTVDRCTYPPSTPSDRIRQLEGLVRELGHTAPTNAASQSNIVCTTQHNSNIISEIRSKDPVLVEEDGTIQYLES